MKFITKVSKYALLQSYFIIILFVAIPTISFAQDVVDTSSSQSLIVEPNLIMTPSNIEPDCHTYTGCGLIVINKYSYQKPKHYIYKRHHVYQQPYCFIDGSY